MDRRSFLKGTFGGVTAAGLLVTSHPRDLGVFTEAVVPGSPIILTKAVYRSGPGVMPGDLLYTKDGVPIGVLTDINVTHHTVDVTSISDNYPSIIPMGLSATGTITFTGGGLRG